MTAPTNDHYLVIFDACRAAWTDAGKPDYKRGQSFTAFARRMQKFFATLDPSTQENYLASARANHNHRNGADHE